MITSTNRTRRRSTSSSSQESSVEGETSQQSLEEENIKEANPEELNQALEQYWNHIKPSDKRAVEKHEVEEIVRDMLNRIESKDPRFKMDMSFRGSTYENINLNYPLQTWAEIDFSCDFELFHLAYYVMLPLTQLTIEEELQAGEQREASLCPEFTKYPLKSEVAETWKDLADRDGKLLDPEKIIDTFINHCSGSIKEMEKSEKYDNFTFVANHHQHYCQLEIQNAAENETLCVVRFTPVIELKKWPESIATGWESRKKQAWPTDDLVTKIQQNPIYLVPTRNCWYDEDGTLLWRYTFTQSVAELFADRESALPNSCVTKVVGILRGFLNDLPDGMKWNHLLKPWHMNSIMLHEFEEHPENEKWQRSEVGERVLGAMTRLKNCLQEENCMDYFIKDKNLMSSTELEDNYKLSVKHLFSGVNKFLDDPLKSVTKLIEDYEFRETCKKVLEPIESFLQNPLSVVKNSMRNEPFSTDKKMNSEDQKKVDRTKVKSKKASGKRGKGVEQQSSSEGIVFGIPKEFITQIEDLLDKSDYKSWRSGCERSEEKEGGVCYFYDMLSLLGNEYRLLDTEIRNLLPKMMNQVKHIPSILNAIIWDGEDVQQFCDKTLELNCNVDQETFDLISKSLPFYGDITVEGNLDFNCTETMLNQIEIASMKNAICDSLRIDLAVLSDGAFRYFAHLIPFVKSVSIRIEEGLPKIFADTLLSACKSLDFDVRMKDFDVRMKDITCVGKKDIGNLEKFFPLVKRLSLNGVEFTLDSMVSFANAAAETFDRETREGRGFPLKKLFLSGCIFDHEGVGWELMKVLSFVESVDFGGGLLSCNNLKEMVRYISELQRQGDREVALKKLHWGCNFEAGSGIGEDLMKISSFLEDVDLNSSLVTFDFADARKMSAALVEMVDRNRDQVRIEKIKVRFHAQAEELADEGLGADIANLVSLVENVDLCICGFNCEDWAEMARVMSEIMHQDKDRFCIKKLKLDYGESMGKDIIKVAALIENVVLSGYCFEADDLKEMFAVLSGLLEQGEEHVRVKKLKLKPTTWMHAKPRSGVGREIMNFVTLIEDVDLDEIHFKADDLQEMSVALSELKKLSESRVRIKKLCLKWHESEGSATAVGKMVPLIQDVGIYCSHLEGNKHLPDMLITMLDLLRQGSDGVCLKKLNLSGCSENIKNSKTDLTNLVALIEEVHSNGLFEGEQFREIYAGLSRLIAEQPDMVKIKKICFMGCNLKEKGGEIIELLSLVENVFLRGCQFKNYDLQQMASILTKRLKNKKHHVRIKHLSLHDCDLGRKERGEELIKLIRNLETVDLQINNLLPADLMMIAQLIEDLTGKDPPSQKHRTKSLVLSVYREIKEHARIAFNVQELHVYSSQVAVRLVKEVAELSTEYGLQGRQSRLKTIKVVNSESPPQELVNLATEIGVTVSVIDKKLCDWCNDADSIDESGRIRTHRDLCSGCKFIINGSSEEVQEINDGCVSLRVPKEATEDINWTISKVSCHIDLAIGEAVLSDIISIGPDGKSVTKAATLKIPYNIYDVPELAEVVCKCFDLEINKWEKVAAVFSKDDNGIRFGSVNIHVATRYMISLRLKRHIARIRPHEVTISPFGGRHGISVTFPPETFCEDSTDCCFKVNKFTAQALQQLQRVGCKASPMLQFDVENGSQPKQAIEVELPIDHTSTDNGLLTMLSWSGTRGGYFIVKSYWTCRSYGFTSDHGHNEVPPPGSGTELIDVTRGVNPRLLENAVLCEINQACSIMAIMTGTQGSGSTLARDILQYIQPQLEMRFYLYVKDVDDQDYCIACSRVEDRSIVDDKLRPMGYETVAESAAINGIFENTEMRIDIEGGVVEKNSPLKLRLQDGKCCFTEKFHLKRRIDLDDSHITFTNEWDWIRYGTLSFNWDLLKDPASIATVEPIDGLEHARFLGMRLENCYLEELSFHDDTVFTKLRSLGLRKKQIQNIKSMLRTREGGFMVEKVAWKELTDAFMGGHLDEDRFENFEKLDPPRMRERILEVIGFLRKPWQEGNNTQNTFVATIFNSKVFEQNDIATVFGRCLGLKQREIDDIEKETKFVYLQEHFITQKGNHCCKLMLELAMKKQGGKINMLEIARSLLKTKLHFKTFKPETRKDLLLQMLLDNLGKVIENHVISKSN